MKFLCLACDTSMRLTSPATPQDGGMSITFRCNTCGHTIALRTNSDEADLLRDLGLRLTARPDDQPPLAPLPFSKFAGQPQWTPEAERRLAAVPAFIQPMIRSAYNDYACKHNYAEITPQVMDAARASLDMGKFML
jgi:hypothetical protein